MRIVIIEDHVMFREVLRKFCTKDLGYQVVGEAGTGRKGKLLIRDTKPDLVLLDWHLPEGDGFEVAEFARLGWPSTRILVLSAHSDDFTLYQVEQSGAHGFVDKNSQTLKTLGEAIKTLGEGGRFYSPAYQEAQAARNQHSVAFAKLLSERERTVLALIGEALSNAEIAAKLGISPKTVETHRNNLMYKLNISSSTKLIGFALEHGFARVVSRRNDKPVYP